MLIVTVSPAGPGAAFRDSLILQARHDAISASVVVSINGQARAFSLASGRELGGDPAWCLTAAERERLRCALQLTTCRLCGRAA